MNIIVPGGFESNFTLGFAKGLHANGVDICVVSCDATASRLTAEGIPNINLRGGVAENRPAWLKLANLAWYYSRLLLFLLRNRGATIHFTGIFRDKLILWEGVFLNLCFRIFARRYIYTVHNLLPHGREEDKFYRSIYRFIYRVPHVLLVHTELTGRRLSGEFGVPGDKIELTSIGLNEEMPVSEMTVAEARRRLGFINGEVCILFFGKIDAYKGLDLLLEAFDSLSKPDARLIIAGTFRNPEYRARILGQIEKMRWRKDVLLEERFVPNEEVEVFFKASAVLCLPYRQISQSGLVFLGPRLGIPMVVTDVGSLREFVTGSFGVVTRTNDAPGLAEALETILASPNRCSSAVITDEARKYQWKNVCRPLASLYSGGSPGATAATIANDNIQKKTSPLVRSQRL